MVFKADGSYTYTPNLDYVGNDSFTVTVSDGNGGTAIATVKINLTPVNDPSVLVRDQQTVLEDNPASGNVLTNDSDVDNVLSVATFSIGGSNYTAGQTATIANVGTLTMAANGDYTFTPVANWNGNMPQATYTTNTGSSATLDVTVTAVNDAPTANGGAVTGTEDTPLTLTWSQFNASDVDTSANNLSIRISTLPADGKLQYLNGTTWEDVAMNKLVSKADIDLGKLRFAPDLHESGDNNFTSTGLGNQKPDYAQFKYTVFDGNSGSSSATMNVDIVAKADAPTISIGGVTLVDGGSSSTIPKGNGLTVQYFAPNANDGMNTTTAGDTANIESAMESSTATSTTIQTAPDKASVTSDSGYRITGLIYLEAGKTYTFSGSRDDTVLMKIGGTAVLNSPYDNFGDFSATPYKPTTSGYFSYEFVMFNVSGIGNFDLNISVNGAPAIDFNATNFNLYSSLTELEKAGGVHGPLIPVGDGGIYPAGLSGQEDIFIKLSRLSVTLVDKDGSESITAISLSGLKAGSIVTDGTNNYTVPVGNDALNLQGWNLANLSIKPPLNFNGQYDIFVNATSTEGSNNDSASSKVTLSVNVLNSYDAAVAIDDGNTIKEDSTPNPISGNVLTNDQNSDSMALTVSKVNGSTTVTAAGTTVQGEFGTLLIKADGTYSYTLDNSNPRVNGLVNGQQLLEKFTYTLSDGTGTSTATLNITINGNSDLVTLFGSSANDQITDNYGESITLGTGETEEGRQFVLQLGATAIGNNPNGTNMIQNTLGINQVIDSAGGNDYVEAGRGNDIIYLGDSGNNNHKVTGILPTAQDIDRTALMQMNWDGVGADRLLIDDKSLSTNARMNVFGGTTANEKGLASEWADLAHGGSGNDVIYGQSGVDLMYGGTGNDYLDGGTGSDGLRGGTGNDVLRGGAGNDILRGDAGSDVFLWMPGDQAQNRGVVSIGNVPGMSASDLGVSSALNIVASATDVVKDFKTTEGDKLDLRDLLQGENHDANNPNDIGNLLNHLHFEKSGTGTVVHISTAGEFVNGAYDASKEDQTIILQGVNLTGATDTDILKNLLQNNRLIVD